MAAKVIRDSDPRNVKWAFKVPARVMRCSVFLNIMYKLLRTGGISPRLRKNQFAGTRSNQWRAEGVGPGRPPHDRATSWTPSLRRVAAARRDGWTMGVRTDGRPSNQDQVVVPTNCGSWTIGESCAASFGGGRHLVRGQVGKNGRMSGEPVRHFKLDQAGAEALAAYDAKWIHDQFDDFQHQV